MLSEKVVNKQIDEAAPHNKIPIFEIIPTPIGYPQVWARSRITRLSLMLWILEIYKIVRYKIEELLEIKGNNLMHLIWHIGNRHIPCQIEENRILIQNDKVIEEMILRLNGQTKVVLEAFDPEGGAYGIGRTHGHRH